MKCEKCKNQEATFYYSCNINGKKTERHLCTDCAKEEGFGGALEYRPVSMFDEMFDDFFGDFYSPRRSLLSDFFGTPMHSLMAPVLPRVNIVIGEPQTEQKADTDTTSKVPEDAGTEVKSRREIAALKHQLREAVRTENFEKAIELRDKLKELEK